MTEREAYVALNMMEKVGPVGVRALVATLGSAAAIFRAERGSMLSAEGVGPALADTILSQRDTVPWEAELDRADRAGARILTPVEPEYPETLRTIHDPPLGLYVRGRVESRDRHAIAVVGTRRPTHYGRECAERFAFKLGKAGFTVVSGLAEGVDTAAHQGALKADARTLAVMGSGLDCLYPASNAGLAERIADQGAVITEFPFGRQPDKTTFPIRNRIVSGLSMGVLVIEAGFQSGALITVNQALEQGRSVFAVPGRIDSAASQGCHKLIRGGAQLVTCVDDVLEEFEFLLPKRTAQAGQGGRPPPSWSADEAALLKLLDGGAQSVDVLIRESGLSPAAVSSILLGLEMKRAVQMLPGRMVERKGSWEEI